MKQFDELSLLDIVDEVKMEIWLEFPQTIREFQ